MGYTHSIIATRLLVLGLGLGLLLPAAPTVQAARLDYAKRWLHGVPCRVPCWEGVTPGQSTEHGTLRILRGSPAVVPGSGKEEGPFESDTATIAWDGVGALERGYAYFDINSAEPIIDEIHLLYSDAPGTPDALTLQEVMQAYGPPTHIDALADLASGPFYIVYFAYAPLGMELGIELPRDTGPPVLHPGLHIREVSFYPAPLKLNDYDKSWTPWQGFHPYAFYCQPAPNAPADACQATPRSQPPPALQVATFALPPPPPNPDFPGPPRNSDMPAIVAGPDGNLWFSVSPGDWIGRISPAGVFTRIPLGTDVWGARGLAFASDGNLWANPEFRPPYKGPPALLRISPASQVAKVPITQGIYSYADIVAGPDGNFWAVEGDQIMRITPGGDVKQLPLGKIYDEVHGIAAGPDGNIWVVTQTDDPIKRITPDGVITRFALPGPDRGPAGITAGPDGALWFTEGSGNRIGRITPAGAITEFPLPYSGSDPQAIITGPDGALWFTERQPNYIGRITLEGAISEYQVPIARSAPAALVAGLDGAIWFTDPGLNRIGRFAVPPVLVPGPPPGMPRTGAAGAWPSLEVGGLLALLAGVALRRRGRQRPAVAPPAI
ncbi:MAG: hypothetical protein M3Z04_16610 [Chloroflexota bacterium]|nr:hypothetical protein [Chloroflexota bacterium]